MSKLVLVKVLRAVYISGNIREVSQQIEIPEEDARIHIREGNVVPLPPQGKMPAPEQSPAPHKRSKR